MRCLTVCGIALLAVLWLDRPGTAAEQRSPFDHLTTGFELLGRHRDLPCEACHVNAVFKGTPRDCVACHGAGTAVRATAKPSSHILTTDRCGACHTPVAWVPAVNFDHTETRGSCSSCHDDVHAPGMPANHIPTAGAPCEDCHLPTQFFTFDGATMDHAVVASIPCSTCHQAGKSFAGAPAVVSRPPPPHPATGECSNCHTTTTFAGAGDLPANHIPLPAADAGNCLLCHTNPSDFSVYVMNHAGISSNCAQCHGSGLSFANMAPPTLKEPPVSSPPHVPVGTLACELCHVPTDFTSFAGTIMRHTAVAGQACDSCHELGVAWYGEPNLWVRPDANHHPAQDCGGSGCHSPRDKRLLRPAAAAPARTAARTLAAPPAASAANPRAAVATRLAVSRGDPAQALPGPRLVDHSQLTGACISCHDGRIATGRPAQHLGASTRCDSCHTTNAWLPARFDHGVIAPRTCSTCHDGVRAIGKPRDHIATIQSCDVCHGTLVWRPVRVDHSGFVSGCASCHNNVAAVGLTITHLRTRRDCSECHRYPAWSVIVFRHASASSPAARAAGLACISCHTNNTEQVTYSGPTSAATRTKIVGSLPAAPRPRPTHAPF